MSSHVQPKHSKHQNHLVEPPLNKEFLESNDFTSLDNPPEPKRTPDPFAQSSGIQSGNYKQDVLNAAAKKQQHSTSARDQRHIFQQKSTPTTIDEVSDPGDDVQFKDVFGNQKVTGHFTGEQATPPPPIRRNSSLYEDFKKDYYHTCLLYTS